LAAAAAFFGLAEVHDRGALGMGGAPQITEGEVLFQILA